MKVFKTQKKLRTYFKEFYSENTTIGFVPTMGGIHKGHVSLIKKSIKFNKKTIVSLFVNPKQFNKIKTPEARLIIAAAVVDDILAIAVLSVVTSFGVGGEEALENIDVVDIAFTILNHVLFFCNEYVFS